MFVFDMHREDIKSEIRKKFGTLTQFEIDHDLPPKSVNEILRGRKSARVEAAILAIVGGSDKRVAKTSVEG